jgi:lipid-binding SYLF domain-containing protein
VARVVSHVSRKDVAGSAFTAYVVYVTAPSGAAIAATAAAAPSPPSTCDASSQSSVSWYVERRYSDFHKLHARLMQCTAAGVTAAVPLSLSFANFPAKHWSSARWLRSLSSSTQTAKQTIEDRAVQLDVWLVNVVDAYNRGMLDGRPESSTSNSSGAHYCTSSCQQAIDEFLSPSLPPPCDRRGNPESDLPNRKKSFGAEDSLKFHNPWTTTMGSSLRQAVRTVEQLTLRENAVDASVPVDLLQCAQGLLFLTVAKAGLVVSGRVGTGLLVARRGVAPDVPCPAPGSSPGYGWSAPCAVSVVGVGWGALAGGDVTHYLIVLTTPKATQNLVANATLQVGAELGVAVGPVGRGANSHLQANGGWSVHAAYAYAVSRGLFIGMSLEGSVLRVRDDVNSVFYGKPGVTAAQILQSPGVKAAEPLYRAIDRALAMPIPEGAFRPSDYFAPSKGSQTYASRGVNQASVYSDSYSIYDINPRQDSNREDPSAFQSNGSHPSVMHSPSWASAAATRPW